MGKRARLSAWVVAGLLAGLLGALGPGRGEAAEKLKIMLGWVAYGRDAGFFAALDRGYYKRAGIDASLVRGFGGSKNIEVLANGGVDFSVGADTPSLIVGRSRGMKVKLVGMFFDTSPYVIYALKGSGITKPKDLEGRKIGISGMDATAVVFPALARIHGVDEKKITWVNSAPTAKIPFLVTGKVDASTAFTTNGPQYRLAAKDVGKEIVEILFTQWGVDVYGMGLAATEGMIREKPDLIRRVVRATYEGIAWAIERPEEAVSLFLKGNPAQSRPRVAEGWEVAMDHILTPAAKEKGLGYMGRKKMEYTRDLFTELLKLPKIPVEDIYTNDFLPGIIPKAGK